MRHNEKSENIARGRRLLVVASPTVGVVAVHRPHRRPNPFVSGQSFHFQMTVALGDTLLATFQQHSGKNCESFVQKMFRKSLKFSNCMYFLTKMLSFENGAKECIV